MPNGFTRSTDDKRVFCMSADQAFRVGTGVQTPVSSGPLGAMRVADAFDAAPDSLTAARRGRRSAAAVVRPRAGRPVRLGR
ncbi:hypothetical protein ACFU8W_30300 [Streptomyces sp. NPDC057565]|uniref:hypothetical protein n=1 Tax=Streptomyces sp. NPDC057565 TaxID=3346169 RepID=UPI0036A42069